MNRAGSSSLALLREMFPGQVRVSLVEAGLVLGFAPRTSYNRYNLGTFPVPATKSGTAKCSPVFCHILDLAAVLDEERGDPLRASQTEFESAVLRKKPGRPRNSPRAAGA